MLLGAGARLNRSINDFMPKVKSGLVAKVLASLPCKPLSVQQVAMHQWLPVVVTHLAGRHLVCHKERLHEKTGQDSSRSGQGSCGNLRGSGRQANGHSSTRREHQQGYCCRDEARIVRHASLPLSNDSKHPELFEINPRESRKGVVPDALQGPPQILAVAFAALFFVCLETVLPNYTERDHGATYEDRAPACSV